MCSRILVLACLLALAGAQLVLEDEPGASLMDGNDGEMTAGAAGGAQRQEAKDPMTRMLQWGMENSDLDEFAKKAQLIRERAPSASARHEAAACACACCMCEKEVPTEGGRCIATSTFFCRTRSLSSREKKHPCFSASRGLSAPQSAPLDPPLSSRPVEDS
jgi:hypothetical protein